METRIISRPASPGVRVPYQWIFLAAFFTAFLCPARFAYPADPLLHELIIAYNLEALETSIKDGSYRGEAGILRIGPEVSPKIGLNVYTDRDYLEAKDLFLDADRYLEKAEKELCTTLEEREPGGHARKAAEYIILHKKALERAQQLVSLYRRKISKENDERLNRELCIRVLDKLLEESLQANENRLRDALAHLYNFLQGVEGLSEPLTTENVRFVNYVFEHYTRQSKGASEKFDLELPGHWKNGEAAWKKVVHVEASGWISIFEKALREFGEKIYPVDPLLFLALMKRESNLDPNAVSSVGAAGLTQIIPGTARSIGMRQIYAPDYFYRALDLLKKERRLKSEAMRTLFQITGEDDGPALGTRARELMQRSLAIGEEREALFCKYREDLVRKGIDDRLNPDLAIRYGYKYFSTLMKMHDGDLSLSLSAYNAGPHPVKKYRGIPPYDETVNFRNRVLNTYRTYLKQAGAL